MSNKLKQRPNKNSRPFHMTAEYISKKTGTRVELLKEYLDAREQEIIQELEQQYNEKLKKSQDYMALNNILIAYLGIRKAYGFTKAFGKYMDVINDAQKELNRRGFEDVRKEMVQITVHDFMFDDDELNKEFGLGGYDEG